MVKGWRLRSFRESERRGTEAVELSPCSGGKFVGWQTPAGGAGGIPVAPIRYAVRLLDAARREETHSILSKWRR
jgi:hypothetical protein